MIKPREKIYVSELQKFRCEKMFKAAGKDKLLSTFICTALFVIMKCFHSEHK